jgi:hypothetical protein
MRTILALLVLAAGLAAQSRVTGVVKDVTGTPLADVRVRLVGDSGNTATRSTRADGRFVFEWVAEELHDLVVEASGFSRHKVRFSPAGRADVDFGTIVLEIPPMHVGPIIDLNEPPEDCWKAAGNPETTTVRLPALAVASPLPLPQSKEGIVRVKVLVVASGVVACADAISGDAALAREAILAARRWRFRPGPPFTGYLDFGFQKRKNGVR